MVKSNLLRLGETFVDSRYCPFTTAASAVSTSHLLPFFLPHRAAIGN